MNNTLSYKPFSSGDEKGISQLILKVFNELVGPDFSYSGRKVFIDYIHPLELLARQRKQNHYILVAKDGTGIAGIIEWRNGNHISLFFVDTNYHNQGIGKKLFQQSLKYILQLNPLLKSIDVHSSLFAVEVYQKLGFSISGDQKEENGIIYVPMIYKITPQ